MGDLEELPAEAIQAALETAIDFALFDMPDHAEKDPAGGAATIYALGCKYGLVHELDPTNTEVHRLLLAGETAGRQEAKRLLALAKEADRG